MELTVAGSRCRLASGGKPFDPATSPWPPLLLIHGAANDRDAWQAVAAGLAAAGGAPLVPDLPGHGLSGGPLRRSIAALADWLPLLLDAAAVEQAVLVGHSMGSLVALDCAARYPQRVSGLALLGSSVPMPVADALLSHAETHPDSVQRMMNEYSLSSGFQLTGGSGHGIWGPGVSLAIMRRSPPGALAIDLANCNDYTYGLTAAAQVACPTLLLVARRDRMTPRRNLPPLQSALRHVRRAEIANCGHAMMNEQPQAVVDELLRFLAATCAGPQPTAPARSPRRE
jgi:pimeloyl-ACP methyl ester carboxylesterase